MATAVTAPRPAAEGVRRLAPFRILAETERRRQLEACLAHVRERDGTLDFEGRTLSTREAFFSALERTPVPLASGIDRARFLERFRQRGRLDGDPRIEWLVAAAESSEGERYGVEGEIRRYERRGLEGVDPIKLYTLFEEQYHTRILLDACRTCGVGAPELKTPRPHHRAAIHLMQHLPDGARYVLVICGEALACVVFRVLIEQLSLFADEPRVEARLRALLHEILLDETLHVAYCRALLSPAAMRVVRALVPLAVLVVSHDMPQLRLFGYGPRRILSWLRRGIEIPREMQWLDADRIDRDG